MPAGRKTCSRMQVSNGWPLTTSTSRAAGLIVRVVVVGLGARRGDEMRRPQARGRLGERARLGPAEVGHFAVGQAGRLVEQLPHRSVGGPRVGQPELRQVRDNRIIQGNPARIHELQNSQSR